jgi:hypothetical protein
VLYNKLPLIDIVAFRTFRRPKGIIAERLNQFPASRFDAIKESRVGLDNWLLPFLGYKFLRKAFVFLLRAIR